MGRYIKTFSNFYLLKWGRSVFQGVACFIIILVLLRFGSSFHYVYIYIAMSCHKHTWIMIPTLATMWRVPFCAYKNVIFWKGWTVWIKSMKPFYFSTINSNYLVCIQLIFMFAWVDAIIHSSASEVIGFVGLNKHMVFINRSQTN